MAIKLECVKTKHPQLHIEAKFYKMMQSGGACRSVSAFVLSQGFIRGGGGGGGGGHWDPPPPPADYCCTVYQYDGTITIDTAMNTIIAVYPCHRFYPHSDKIRTLR